MHRILKTFIFKISKTTPLKPRKMLWILFCLIHDCFKKITLTWNSLLLLLPPPPSKKGHKVHSQRVILKIKPLHKMYSSRILKWVPHWSLIVEVFSHQYSNIHKLKSLSRIAANTFVRAIYITHVKYYKVQLSSTAKCKSCILLAHLIWTNLNLSMIYHSRN